MRILLKLFIVFYCLPHVKTSNIWYDCNTVCTFFHVIVTYLTHYKTVTCPSLHSPLSFYLYSSPRTHIYLHPSPCPSISSITLPSFFHFIYPSGSSRVHRHRRRRNNYDRHETKRPCPTPRSEFKYITESSFNLYKYLHSFLLHASTPSYICPPPPLSTLFMLNLRVYFYTSL